MNLSNDQVIKAVSHFLRRYHVMLYTFTVISGVAVAMFLLSGVLNNARQPDAVTAEPASFDRTTIKRLDRLSTSTNPNTHFQLPAGRVNPFAE